MFRPRQPSFRFHPFLVQVMMVLPSRNVLVRLSRLVAIFQQFFSWRFFSQGSCCRMYVWTAQHPFLIFFMINSVAKSHVIWVLRKNYFKFCAKRPHFCRFLARQAHWTWVHMLLKIKFISPISVFCIFDRVIFLYAWYFFNVIRTSGSLIFVTFFCSNVGLKIHTTSSAISFSDLAINNCDLSSNFFMGSTKISEIFFD